MTTKLKIEHWPIGKVLAYAQNARMHSEKQVDAIEASIREFGFINPVLVDAKGVLIAGHGRILALKQMGEKTVPVIRLGHLTEPQAKALRIADNALPMQATWDADMIRLEISALKLEGYDVKLLGFSEAQLRNWNVDPAPAADPNAIPAASRKPAVKRGEIWSLGEHRLACADCTKPEVWKTMFERDRAAAVFTDPPYGVSYQSGEKFDIIEGDKKRRDDLYRMLLLSLGQMAKIAADTAAFYIWHAASSTREDFAGAMKAVGLVERQYLMWVKPAIVFGHADYQWQHEPCFYAAKDGNAPAFYGERAESTVWQAQLVGAKETSVMIGSGILLLNGEGGSLYIQAKAPKNKKLRQVRITKDTSVYLTGTERQDGTVWEVGRDGAHEHPTQKPVELARRAIENSSKPGEIIADGFLGSGTTLIGAEMTGRRCFGCELDPVYADVIIRRWETFTGDKATLLEAPPAKARRPAREPAE